MALPSSGEASSTHGRPNCNREAEEGRILSLAFSDPELGHPSFSDLGPQSSRFSYFWTRLNWTEFGLRLNYATGFPVLQPADGASWDFSASIILGADSHNKSPLRDLFLWRILKHMSMRNAAPNASVKVSVTSHPRPGDRHLITHTQFPGGLLLLILQPGLKAPCCSDDTSSGN